MALFGTPESNKDDSAPTPIPKSPEASFLHTRPRTDSNNRGPAKLNPMFLQMKNCPIQLQTEPPDMVEGVLLQRRKEHCAQSVIIDRPFSRSRRTDRHVSRERTWSDDSWKDIHQQPEDDQSLQISGFFQQLTKFAAESLFLSPSAKRRVRFQVTKAETCTMEICPYSEIYGVHPAFFEFGPAGDMLPPDKAQSPSPAHRFSLGANAEQIIHVEKMGSIPMEEWFATSCGSMTPLAQVVFQQRKISDGAEKTHVTKPDADPLAEFATVLLECKAALDAAVPVVAAAVKKREFIGRETVGAVECPANASVLTIGAPASAEDVRDFKRAVEIDRLQDRKLFRTAFVACDVD